MSEAQRGILAILAACTIWGLSSIFYKALAHVPPLEVLAWRGLSALVFFLLVLAAQRRLGQVTHVFSSRSQTARLLLAALLIGINWLIFVTSVQTGRAVESALGYYIFPLAAVLLGRLLFGERLSLSQWSAVALAAIAVVVLTIGLGTPPWIPLLLASTFALYGAIKKSIALGPILSVLAEVILLAPLALAWLLLAPASTSYDSTTFLLLALAGPLTGVPLLLLSYGAQRVRLSTMGLVQYWNPTLQFLVATQILGEAITRPHMIAFPLIWMALTLYSFASLRGRR